MLTQESLELMNARDLYGGRLTIDFIAERLSSGVTPVAVNALEELTELDCSNCAIRAVDLLAGGGSSGSAYASPTYAPAGSVPLTNLRAVNLEHNLLTSLSGLLLLPHVRVLCLNHNRVECLVPNARGVGVGGPAAEAGAPRGPLATAPLAMPLLERLEVLYLCNNGIKELGALQLYRLPNLRSLFLHGATCAALPLALRCDCVPRMHSRLSRERVIASR